MALDQSDAEVMKSKMNDNSPTITNPIFDILEPSFEDISADSLQYIEYYDTNVNGANNVTDFRIVVNEKQNWHLLSKSYIQIQFQLLQADGTLWGNGSNVALQNNGVGIMSRYEIKLDDEITEYVDFADICNTVQNLVYMSSEYGSTIARNMLWYPDTIDSSNILDSTNIMNENNVYNLGLISFTNTTLGQTVNIVSAAGGLLSSSAGVATDVITASYTLNGTAYPIQFYSVSAGVFNVTSVNLSLINAGGVTRLGIVGGANGDVIYAVVNTLGLQVQFSVNFISIMLLVNANAQFIIGGVAPANNLLLNGIVPTGPVFQNVSVQNGLDTINYGQRKRQQILNASTMITVQIPASNVFGLLKSMKHVTKGMKYELRMTRNLDNNIIYSAAGNAITMIQKVSWFIPRVLPNKSVLPKLEAKLMGAHNYRQLFIDTQIFRTNLITMPASNTLFQIRTKRRRPVKAYICFQIDDPTNANAFATPIARLSGGQTMGKRIFDNIKLTSLRLVLNSTVQYPERQYALQFNQILPNGKTYNDYSRVYSELMRTALKDHDIDQGSQITYDNFPSLFPIFAIDLSERESYTTNPESALLEIYWTNTTIINYYMYVLIESERTINIASSNGLMKFVSTE